MTAHTTQSATTARLIHVHGIAERARAALDATRKEAWNAGSADVTMTDAESKAAAQVTDAVAELVTLALGIETAA